MAENVFFDALSRKRLAWVQSSHFWFPSMLMYHGTQIDELKKEVNIVRVVADCRHWLRFCDQKTGASAMAHNYRKPC